MGIGLSAASGFRVFVPLLGANVAAQAGVLDLSANMAWMGTPLATVAFGAAAAVEVVAFYVPWLDNALDGLAVPLATGAGTLLTASVLGDVPPVVQWTVATIAGGGTAGLTQGATTLVRGGSTATTGGLANPLVATGEMIGSVGATIGALLVPGVTALVLGLLGLWVWRTWRQRSHAR